MARKDIEIRIKARDEASRNAKKVSDALKQLGTTGNNLGSTGAKVGGAMSAIGDGLGKLQGKLGGIDNLGKLVTKLNETTGTVAKLEKELAESQRTLDAQTQKQRAAAQVSADLKARLEAETAAQKQRAERLKEMTNARNKDTKSVLDAARAAEKLQKIVTTGVGGTSGPRYPKKGVGVEAGAPFKSARESFGAFLQPEIDAGLGGKAALTAQVNSLKAANDAAKVSIGTLRGEIKAASAEERGFAADTEKAAIQVTSLNEKILKATGAWSKLDDEAGKASKELGGIALSQEAVAKATQRAEDELRKQTATLAAYERLSAKKLRGGGTISDPTQRDQARAQSDALRQAREEVKLLRDEQMRLDATMRSGSGNVSAQVDAYDRMTRAVKLAEEQVRKLEIQQRLAQNTGATGFAKWAKVYNPIVTGAQAAAQSQERLSQSTRKSAAEAGKIAPMAQRNTSALRNQAAATDKAGNSMVKFGRDTRTTLSFVQRMRGEVLAMTSGFLGFYAALNRGQQAMEAFMAVQKAENRLGAAFDGDVKKVATEIGFLNAEADRLGFTFAALADGYGKISVAASSAGFSIADTRQIFTSLTEAARVNGTSMDELNGVLKALDQMMSKGKVQAEELRGQLGDRMSGAFKMFADGLGMTTAELDKAMKAGEVYADRETLLKFADRITEKYGSQVPKAMQGLAASLGMFERDMEKVNLALADGFVPAVQEALKAFNAFVNSAEGLDTFRSMGETAGSLIKVLALIPQHFDLISAAAQALLAIGIGRVFASVAGSVLAAGQNLTGFAAKMTAAQAAGKQLTLTQRTLGLGYISLVNSMRAAELRILAWNNATRLGALGNRAMAYSLGALRLAVVGVGTAFRALSALLGGPIGIAITAISAGILLWESDADKATAAMATHERQIAKVQAAYNSATGEAEKLKAVAQAISLPAAEKNFTEQSSALDRALKRMTNQAEMLRNIMWGWKNRPSIGNQVDPVFKAQAEAVMDMLDKFVAGEKEITEFRETLNGIYAATENDGLKELIGDLLEIADGSGDSEQSIDKLRERVKVAAAQIEAAGGKIDDATKALLGLGEAAEETDDAFDNSKFVEEYTKAIDELKGKIPSLTEELKRLAEQTELNGIAWKGMVAAWNAGDYSKILEIGALWARGTGEANNAMLDKSVTGSLVDRIVGIESGGNANAKNPNSTATGAGQFIESTWLAMFKKYFPERAQTMTDAAMLELRKNADISKQMVELYARENAAFLQRMGVQINDANLYLAHFLGPQGAANLLKAAPETPTSAVLGADQINANASILEGKSAAQVIAWAQQKVGISNQQLAINQQLGELDAKAAEDAKDQADATKKRLADIDHQIAQQRLINGGKEREAAIEDAIRAAKAENPNLNEQEIQAIRDRTAALWEQQNVNREIELQEERINQLQSLRQALMEQMDQARAAGDSGQLSALQTELDGVNSRLQEAIANGIKMWEAVGGIEAEAKIANLKTMQGSIKASQQQFGLFGLTMQTWQGVFDSAINGVVGAFEAMAQAIANGENAWQAFGSAALQVLAQVLQQIAVAIIRMQILKMLQGMGGGIGEMATAMLGHTGGVVGSSAIGTGNSIRSSGWVQSALTYHTGGIAGLKPDEVSATLKKGEEILTEEDPRHRANLGGETKGPQGSRLTQVLAIGDNEIANAMKGKSGQDVTLTHIKREAATVKRILGL